MLMCLQKEIAQQTEKEDGNKEREELETVKTGPKTKG